MGRAMLFLVSGLVIIAGIIQMSNNNRTELLPARTTEYYYEQNAKNISASLIDNAIQNLLADMEWTGSISSDNNYEGKGKLITYVQGDSGLDTVDHSVDEWNQYKALLVSTASYGGYTAEIEVLMQRDSFSKFSYFTNDEKSTSGTNIWWFGDDEVTGPIHSNGTFRMAESPTFHGFITSPNDWIEHEDGADPNFNGGSNFSLTTTRDLPDNSQINLLKNAANMGGLTFDDDVELDFFIDDDEGYVSMRDADCYWNCSETEYRLSDYNGNISVEGKVEVKGTLKGQVTVYSSEEIEIMGDLFYHTNPLVDSTSTDLLGLVSQGDVVIDENAHDHIGSSNLTIQASIMALNNSFYVEDYTDYGFRGDLNILGGIVQKNRGPVGTFGGYYGTTGFTKKYEYDSRLQNSIPPNFPRESIFTIVYWKEKVVEKNS